jgi:hypothetical protein
MSSSGGKKHDDYHVCSLQNRSLKNSGDVQIMVALFLDNTLTSFAQKGDKEVGVCSKVKPRNQIFAQNSGLTYLGASTLDEFLNFESVDWLKNLFHVRGVTSVTPFIGHPAIEEACKVEGVEYRSAPGDLAMQARSKWYLYQLCLEFSIPTLPTRLINAEESFTLTEAEYKKPDISAGNIGNESLSAGTHCFDYDIVLQPDTNMIGSPSVQVEFKGGEYTIIAIIDQLIDGGYNGLTYPTQLTHDQQKIMLNAAHSLARRFADLGMSEGRFSLDFYLDREGNLYAGDLNLRQGGVSEPARIIQAEKPLAMIVDQKIFVCKPPVYGEEIRELIPWQNGQCGLIILGKSIQECQERLSVVKNAQSAPSMVLA